jgi:hypothetical protein
MGRCNVRKLIWEEVMLETSYGKMSCYKTHMGRCNVRKLIWEDVMLETSYGKM